MSDSAKTPNFTKLVNFMFEVQLLSSVERSGYRVLGGVKQSVTEHCYNMAMFAYAISQILPDIDSFKLMKMCLFHDLPEVRTGDQHYINKKYVQADEEQVILDQSESLIDGAEYIQLLREFNAGETLEAQIAKDIDQLEFLLILKRAKDIGHNDADRWAYYGQQRVKTEIGKRIAEAIKNTRSDAWWFTDDENWWVNGNNNHK